MEVGGLDVPTSGSVFMNGMDISKFNDEKMIRIRRQNIGFVFQFYNLIPNLNVAENIMLPLLLDGKKLRDYKKSLKDILEVVGLSDKRGHTPRELSGGQQQRKEDAAVVQQLLERWKAYQIRNGRSREEADSHMKRYGVDYFPLTVGTHFELMRECGFQGVELIWMSYMQAGFMGIKL